MLRHDGSVPGVLPVGETPSLVRNADNRGPRMTYAERHSHWWSAREPSTPGGTMLPLVAHGASWWTT